MIAVTANAKISEVFGLKVPNGDVGIEIEAEGILGDINDKFWKTVPDGSLRNGLEYVLKKPVPIDLVANAMDAFAEGSRGFTFRDSIRTSVHIHVNAGNYTVSQTYAAITAFWLLENLLVHLQGPTREGNLFCLRAKDSEGIIYALANDLKKGHSFREVTTDNYRYSSLNLTALPKYGSLEFRFLKGTHDAAYIRSWAELLHGIVAHGAAIGSPEEVLNIYDSMSAREFAEAFLPRDMVRRFDEEIGQYWPSKIRENYAFVFQIVHEWRQAKKSKFHRPVINCEHEDIDPEKYRMNHRPAPTAQPAAPAWARDIDGAIRRAARVRPIPTFEPNEVQFVVRNEIE